MRDIYVAINGDDVGGSIGSAVASDDRESLNNKTSKVRDIHSQIDQWVEGMGGEVIMSSGDEGIYTMPEEAMEHLEDLRAKYSEHTEHTLTIGVGGSMSEASKALIYGKMSSKDQIVEYTPEIENSISGQQGEGEQGPAGYEKQYEDDLPAEQDVMYQRDNAMEEEQGMTEDQAQDIAEDDAQEDDSETVIDDAAQDKHAEEPEHEMEMGPDEEIAHDAAENEADEMDDDLIEADEEAEGAGIDGQVDGEDIGEMDAADEMSEEMPMEDDAIEDPDEPDAGMDEEEDDHGSMLADMIHSHMAGEDEGLAEDEGMGGEEELAEEDNTEQLRADISESLNSFKQNRDMIEGMQSQSPELYNSVIVMLRSMIEMAKRLNMSPEQDMAEEEPMEEMQQEQAPMEGQDEQPMEMSEKK